MGLLGTIPPDARKKCPRCNSLLHRREKLIFTIAQYIFFYGVRRGSSSLLDKMKYICTTHTLVGMILLCFSSLNNFCFIKKNFNTFREDFLKTLLFVIYRVTNPGVKHPTVIKTFL